MFVNKSYIIYDPRSFWVNYKIWTERILSLKLVYCTFIFFTETTTYSFQVVYHPRVFCNLLLLLPWPPTLFLLIGYTVGSKLSERSHEWFTNKDIFYYIKFIYSWLEHPFLRKRVSLWNYPYLIVRNNIPSEYYSQASVPPLRTMTFHLLKTD